MSSKIVLDDLSPQSVSNLLFDTLSRQCADETTTIGKLFSVKGTNLVNNSLGGNSDAKPIKISFQLTSDQQAKLKKNFPGREPVFF